MAAALAATLGCLLTASAATSLVLALAALAVVLWPGSRAAPAWGVDRLSRSLFLGALAVCCLLLGTRDDLEDLLLEGEVRAWNVYHYYLGSKYFPELGYHDLYRASLAADAEGPQRWADVAKKVRDLETYRLVEREALAPYEPSERFTPQRWQEFRSDLDALAQHRGRRSWKNVFRDRGYNGTPIWTTIGRLLGTVVPADSGLLVVACAVDLVLLTLTGWLVYRTFGGATAMLVFVLFTVSPFNVARLVGGLLQTGWWCALVAGICFHHRGRPVVAGILVALATALRGFPVIFPAMAMVPVAWTLLRAVWARHLETGLPGLERSGWAAMWTELCRIAGVRKAVHYGLAIAVALLTLGAASTLGNGRGVQGWIEFGESIALHDEHHRLGDRRVGLEHALTVSPRSWLEGEGLAEVSDRRRLENLESSRALLWALQLGLVGAALWLAVRSGRSAEGQLMAVVILFALFVVSRYYMAVLALLPLVAARGRMKLARWLSAGQLVVFAFHYGLVWAGATWHTSYALLNWALLVYLVSALVLLAAPHRMAASVGDAIDDRGAVDDSWLQGSASR